MGLDGLPTQIMNIPFAAGLSQRGNKQATNPPALAICKDMEFDEIGGLRTRFPCSAMPNLDEGSSPLANCRRIVAFKDELLVFTDTALFSWDASQQIWKYRGDHLAVDIDETIRFSTNGDQLTVDRAELGDVIVFAWIEGGAPYIAAINKTTGAVIQPPQALQAVPGTYQRPRVIALQTKILYLVVDGSPSLVGFTITPATASADIVLGITTTPTSIFTSAQGFNLMYDVVKVPGQDRAVAVARRNPTTSYEIIKITSALAVTRSTKARTCIGPIAVSVESTATVAQVCRDLGNDGTGTLRVRGDQISVSALTDGYINQEIGTYTRTYAPTTLDQLTCAYSSTASGGQYTCYVFWETGEVFAPGTTADFMPLKYNWVDTANNLGSQGVFAQWNGIASRAFEYNGDVYLWTVFNSGLNPLQGTYLLYRNDGTLVATSRTGNAYFTGTIGWLPGVALTGGSTTFSWAGVFVREPGEETKRNFTARAPRDIAFTFDSDNARRTAEIGDTLYISGSPILQYDGVRLSEVGFLIGPSVILIYSSIAGGSLSAGTYGWKPSLRWRNAAGEVERSSSMGVSFTNTVALNDKQQIDQATLTSTRKDKVTYEWWRSLVNPTAEAPFYLVSNDDPTATGLNGYIANDRTGVSGAYLTQFVDGISDVNLASHEQNAEGPGVLEPIPPPSAKLILASGTRLFLAGIAGAPDQVWYSRQRNVGEVVSFNDVLTFDVPPDGGDITALAFLNETLIVFREKAVYAIPGDGFDNGGNGSNFGPARVLSPDVGAISQECVTRIHDGLLFKCVKGWYVLDQGWSVKYVGAAVSDFDSEAVLATHVAPGQQQVRIVTGSRVLVWDYLVSQWGEWTIGDGVHATVWNGQYTYLTTTGPKIQQSTYSGINYAFDVETAWIKINELQGRGLVRWIQLLGEYRTTHSIRVRIARNYEGDGAGGWNYNYDQPWTSTLSTVGGAEQLRVAPRYKRCQAIKVRLTGSTPPSGEAMKLTGLALGVAVEEGLYNGLPAAQKV